MAGYIRQSTFVDGDTITAALFNNEYNQLVNAFSNTSGHKHDGTTAEGPVIGLIGDAGETSPNNKVLIDTTNNYIEFYVEVSSAPVQQLYIADGAIIPVTDSDIDLGTTSLRFKDTYTDTVTTTGNVSIGGDLTVTGSATISGNLTFGDADTDSINLAAEIDSDIIPNTDGTYDLGSATKEWQDLYIDGTANIDSLIADTADINGGTIDGVTIGGTTAGAVTFTDLSDGTITITAFADEDDMSSNSATLVPTQQSVKAYVDSQVTAQDLDITTDSGTIAIDLDSETLTVTGGTGLDSSATGNAVTLAIDSTVATLTGTQTLTNKTLTSPDVNTPDIDGGTIDSSVIGGTTPAAGTFTTLTVDDITINGSTISDASDLIVDVGGNITLDADGGNISFKDAGVDFGNINSGSGNFNIKQPTSDKDILFIGNDGGSAVTALTLDMSAAGAATFNAGVTATSFTTTGTITYGSLSDGTITIANFIDDDTFGTASATTLATSESIKAYVDTTVAATNEVVEDTTPQLGGDLDTNGSDILFGDNDKAVFGAGSDLEIYHSGNDSFIRDAGIGDLYIRSSSALRLQALSGENYAVFTENGAATFYYDNGTKLSTTSTGIDVTGVITTDGLTTSADINFGDNDKAVFGAGSDLQIYHDPNHSIINESGTGSLKIQGDNIRLQKTDGSENMITAVNDGAVTLFYDDEEKLATTSTGIDVTGTVTSDGLIFEPNTSMYQTDATISNYSSSNGVYINGNASGWLRLNGDGTGRTRLDLFGGTSGSANFVTGNTNSLNIANNGDISFYNTAGTSQALFWDASAESLGIGTTSPTDKLDVAGALRLTANISFDSNKSGRIYKASNHGLAFHGVTGTANDFAMFNPAGQLMITNPTGTNNVSLIPSGLGNVGIGTTSPSAPLHVNNNSGIRIGSSSLYAGLIKGEQTPVVTVGGSTVAGMLFTTAGTSGGSGHIGFEIPSNDADDGFYIATDSNSDGTVDTLAMKIKANGNVGIGENNPTHPLEVQTSSGKLSVEALGGSSIRLASSGTMGMNIAEGFGYEFDINNSEVFRINSQGKVGIGTTSPASKLHITGTGTYNHSPGQNTTSDLIITSSEMTDNNYHSIMQLVSVRQSLGTGNGANGYLGFSTIDDSNAEGIRDAGRIAIVNETGTARNSATSLSFWTNAGGADTTAATEKMRIDSSGNVGIGDSSPSSITSDVSSLSLNGTNTGVSGGIIYKVNGSIKGYHYINSGNILHQAASGIGHRFLANDTDAMKIDSSGNVGIGITDPDQALEIGAAGKLKLSRADNARSLQLFNDNSFGTIETSNDPIKIASQVYTRFDVNGSEAMRIDSSGNLLVGTTSTAFRGNHTIASGSLFSTTIAQTKTSSGASILNLDFSGATPNNTADYFIYAEDASAVRFRVFSNGNVENVNNSYGALSDEKLKENIVDATDKLEDLKQVKVRNYNLIGNDKKQIGVIAQELETIFPSMVEEKPDLDDDNNDLGTTTKSVKYSVFVPILIKAIQEQQTQIEALQSEINLLKGE